jgi:hypothetical protein
MQSISEDLSDDDDQHDDESAAQPPAPEGEDPDPENLEEDDLDVDQIGDSDDEIPEENWEPAQEQRRGLEFAHDNSGHPIQSGLCKTSTTWQRRPKGSQMGKEELQV